MQIGRELTPKDVAGACSQVYPRAFGQVAIMGAPFPADPHYDAKGWELCVAMRGPGQCALLERRTAADAVKAILQENLRQRPVIALLLLVESQNAD